MGAAGAADPTGAGRYTGLTLVFILAAAALIALHLWCIVDAVRTRRRWLWVIALLIVPLVSPLAYLASGRSAAKEQAVLPTQVGRDTELELAHRYAREGRHELAIPHYRAADPGGHDGYIGYRLANAQYRTGDPAGALATLDAMGPVPIQHDPEFVPLLRAEILVALDRKEEAAAVYASVMPRPPSLNAFGDYADVLLKLDRPREATAVLELLEERLSRFNSPPGDRLAEPLRRAMERLAELRAQP